MSDAAESPTPDPKDAARARDLAAIRVLLGADAPPPDLQSLGAVRPPSAATFCLLQQTFNEWALGIPAAEMANRHFATLAWLYLQSVPPAEAAAVAFDPARFGAFSSGTFTAAVLTWADRTDAQGQPLFSIPMLDAAVRYITAIMEMKAALEYDIEKKPDAPPKENAPPNS